MLFVFKAKSLEEAASELKKYELEPVATVEGEEIELFVLADAPPSSRWKEAEVSWEEEWEKNSCTGELPFKMEAGPGFGDLSHPTTRLMMEGLDFFFEEIVVDVGCGSGILTLAALHKGAKELYAIDIDREALSHTERNLKINGWSAHLLLPGELPKLKKPAFVLMNMIRLEQEIAWSSIKKSILPGSRLLTSGILLEERARYLAFAEGESLTLLSEHELLNWKSFLFKLDK